MRPAASSSLDRTYEELKREWDTVPEAVEISLDRTYEELKPDCRNKAPRGSHQGLDRTYEELKQGLKIRFSFSALIQFGSYL